MSHCKIITQYKLYLHFSYLHFQSPSPCLRPHICQSPEIKMCEIDYRFLSLFSLFFLSSLLFLVFLFFPFLSSFFSFLFFFPISRGLRNAAIKLSKQCKGNSTGRQSIFCAFQAPKLQLIKIIFCPRRTKFSNRQKHEMREIKPKQAEKPKVTENAWDLHKMFDTRQSCFPNPSKRTALSTRVNCTKCANLVSKFSAKIIKIVPTKCHILKLQCTKFDLKTLYS